MKQFKKETELARIIIRYLQEIGWEIYQEVQVSSFSSIADIVAVQNNLIWVLECKLSLSLDLISQAENWKSCSHYVSIVIPYKPYIHGKRKGRDLALRILRDYGIGCFTVQKHDKDWYGDSSATIAQIEEPKLNRKALTNYIRNSLTEEQKYWAEAGNAQKLRYTPFQDTKRQVISYIKNNPGCTFKELIDNIKHHYVSDTSAITSLRQWINIGIISEIYINDTTKQHRLYLK